MRQKRSVSLLLLTAVYATTFYRFVVANPVVLEAVGKEKIDFAPFIVQFVVILLFSATLLGRICVLFNEERFVNGYENIQKFVAFVETVFAVFLGLTFSRLFPMQSEQITQPPETRPDAVENNQPIEPI